MTDRPPDQPADTPQPTQEGADVEPGAVGGGLVFLAFERETRASEFMAAIADLQAREALVLRDAVRIDRTRDGRAKVRELFDLTPTEGALSSGAWGLLIGVLFGGPVGALIGGAVGAATGAAAGAVIDLGIPDDTVARMREALPEGKVGVLVLATATDPQAVLEEFHRFAGEAELGHRRPAPRGAGPGAGLVGGPPPGTG
ncbi:MAG: DUF1269 domain-containing protein [Microthrixaceae bacterium]